MAIILLCFVPENKAYADKVSDLEKKIEESKAKKSETQDEIKEGKATLDTLNSTAGTLKNTLNTLNGQLEDVSSNLAVIEGKIESKDVEIELLSDELADASVVEKEQYEAMKKRIRYMYERQNYAIVETLLGVSSFSEFLNNSCYIEALASYDRKMLEEYKHTREVIEEAKELLEDEKIELETLKESAQEEQDRVSLLVNRTSTSIKNYQDEIEATEEELKEKEAQMEAEEQKLASLSSQLAEEKRLAKLASVSAWRSISDIQFAEGDRKLMANIIYCEAGNQCYEAQLGVGAVVMNRVMSSVYPDTVVGVVYQKYQFTPARSGRLALALANDSATTSCYAAADAAMSGQTNVGNALAFRYPTEGIVGIQIGKILFY